jgi:DNA-directed RNA polymerase subunit RPC12/RpoP
MVFSRYNYPLPNNGSGYAFSEQELVKLLDSVYDQGYRHGVESTIVSETVTATYDNLTVTVPVGDPDHMWNNNNEYDYKTVKDGRWAIPAYHIVTDTVEGHQIDLTNTLGDCGVIYVNSDIKCPHCGESFYTEMSSESTCVYYPPIWKNGVNVNPDRNKATTHYKCLKCNKEFDI